MADNKPRIAIVTNVIANYRADFYRRILANTRYDIKVFCQNSIAGMNLKTAHNQFTDQIVTIRSWGLAKEKMAWQFLPFLRLYRDFDVLFFYGNPRVLSNVVYSLLFKMLGKKVVLWGQAHTAGANPLTEKIRLAWWRLFDFLFLYTDAEVDYLKQRGFKHQIMIGMNNGLNQDAIDDERALWSEERLLDWQQQQSLQGKTLLLSCARLEPKNEFELMIPALKQLIQSYPNLVWCVIGQGEQEAKLVKQAKQEGLEKHIRWLGAIYQESELAPWFLSSIALIHPGAIGLSLLHAFSYGIPVITHDDISKHMPEIAAFKNTSNGFYFSVGNSDSLYAMIMRVLENENNMKTIKEAAYQTAKYQFNTTIMAHRFCKIANLIYK